jgi:hypothetical protein
MPPSKAAAERLAGVTRSAARCSLRSRGGSCRLAAIVVGYRTRSAALAERRSVGRPDAESRKLRPSQPNDAREIVSVLSPCCRPTSEMSANRRQPRERRGSWFRWGAWLPLATLVGVTFYARRFDGWGSWATAPLFLLPVALSAVLLLIGAFKLRSEQASGQVRRSTLAACALGAAPLLWFLSRVVQSQ